MGATPVPRSRRITRMGEIFLNPRSGGRANASRQMNPVIDPTTSGRVPGSGNVGGSRSPNAAMMPRWTTPPRARPSNVPTMPITNNTPR